MRSAGELAQLLADALEVAGYDYAIGGALALAVAGVPRGTLDVDINVFVSESGYEEVAQLLAEAGVALDVDRAVTSAKADGMFAGDWQGMRVDVFVPSIPFSHEAARTRRQVIAPDGWSGWFLAPEAICVFKLLFFRAKDLADIERLVAVRGPDLDHAYIRRWLVEMMGEDDERVGRWDGFVVALAGSHEP